MADAFKPRKFIFLHACANCDYGKMVTGVGGSPLAYICTVSGNTNRLFGSHICDIEAPEDENQVNWFEDMKEDK